MVVKECGCCVLYYSPLRILRQGQKQEDKSFLHSAVAATIDYWFAMLVSEISPSVLPMICFLMGAIYMLA